MRFSFTYFKNEYHKIIMIFIVRFLKNVSTYTTAAVLLTWPRAQVEVEEWLEVREQELILTVLALFFIVSRCYWIKCVYV